MGWFAFSSITDEMSDRHCQLASKNKELLFEYESGVIAIGERFIVCEYEGENISAPPYLCLTHMNGPESEPEIVDFDDGSSFRHNQVLSQLWKGSREWLNEVVDVCIKTHIIPLDTCTQIDPAKIQNDDTEKVEKLCYMIKARYISTERDILTPDLC